MATYDPLDFLDGPPQAPSPTRGVRRLRPLRLTVATPLDPFAALDEMALPGDSPAVARLEPWIATDPGADDPTALPESLADLFFDPFTGPLVDPLDDLDDAGWSTPPKSDAPDVPLAADPLDDLDDQILPAPPDGGDQGAERPVVVSTLDLDAADVGPASAPVESSLEESPESLDFFATDPFEMAPIASLDLDLDPNGASPLLPSPPPVPLPLDLDDDGGDPDADAPSVQAVITPGPPAIEDHLAFLDLPTALDDDAEAAGFAPDGLHAETVEPSRDQDAEIDQDAKVSGHAGDTDTPADLDLSDADFDRFGAPASVEPFSDDLPGDLDQPDVPTDLDLPAERLTEESVQSGEDDTADAPDDALADLDLSVDPDPLDVVVPPNAQAISDEDPPAPGEDDATEANDLFVDEAPAPLDLSVAFDPFDASPSEATPSIDASEAEPVATRPEDHGDTLADLDFDAEPTRDEAGAAFLDGLDGLAAPEEPPEPDAFVIHSALGEVIEMSTPDLDAVLDMERAVAPVDLDLDLDMTVDPSIDPSADAGPSGAPFSSITIDHGAEARAEADAAFVAGAGRRRDLTRFVSNIWDGPLGWRDHRGSVGYVAAKVAIRSAAAVLVPLVLVTTLGMGSIGSAFPHRDFDGAATNAAWGRGPVEYRPADVPLILSDGSSISASAVASLDDLYARFWPTYVAAADTGDVTSMRTLLSPSLAASYEQTITGLRAAGQTLEISGYAEPDTAPTYSEATDATVSGTAFGPIYMSVLAADGSIAASAAYGWLDVRFEKRTDGAWRIVGLTGRE